MTGRLLAKLIAAILALTAVISVAMLQVDWTGVAASEQPSWLSLLHSLGEVPAPIRPSTMPKLTENLACLQPPGCDHR